MSNDSISAAYAGFVIGLLLMLVFTIAVEPTWVQSARKAKEECELNIPRKETCVIIALPKSKD